MTGPLYSPPPIALSRQAAAARGLSFLQRLYPVYGFQSFISQTPDMLNPVASPDALYPGLATFPLEVFTTMIVTDLIFKWWAGPTLRTDLLRTVQDAHTNGIFHFFADRNLLPADVDCTAIGLSILFETGWIDPEVVNRVVDIIVNNTDDEGVVKVYFPPAAHRQYVDPVVCVNALYLMALLGRQDEAQATEAFIFRFLTSKAYWQGTRYYPSPDAFLYFLARLGGRFDFYRERLNELLRQALIDRAGATNMSLDLAMRLIVARQVDITNADEGDKLLRQQNDDGAWPADAFFRFGRRHGFFGSQALTTAFAVAALLSPNSR